MSGYSAIRGKGLAFLSLLWSLWFTIMVVRMSMAPMLPLIEDEFLIKHAQATSLVFLFSLGGALSTFASGVFAGAIGYKRFIVACLAAQVAVFLVIPHVRTFSQLLVLLFVLGFVWGTYFPCIIPIVTSHFAPTVWGRALAIQDSGATFSAFAAPLLAVLMLRFISWQQFFYVFAVAYAAAGTVFLFSTKEVRMEKRLSGSLRGLFRNRAVWIMSILWVCSSGAFWGVYQVMPLYFTKELSLGTQYANTVFSFSRAGGFIFGITMGFVVDRFSLRKSLFAIVFLTGLFTMLIGHTSLIVVEVAMFLQGTVITGFFAVGLMTISRTFPMEERSMASGLMTTMGGVLGSGLMPYLFGLAGDHLSFRFGLVVFGAIVLLASGLVYFLKIPKREEPAR